MPSALRPLLCTLLCCLLGSWSSIGCSNCTPDHPCCRPGEDCSCEPGVERCTIDCPMTGDCRPRCDDSFASCDIDCRGAECDADCRGGDDCRTVCGDDCKTSCSAASGCEAECGERCHYECRSVSSCRVEAGADSVIRCESVGDCQAKCTGPCRLECPQSGGCSLECVMEIDAASTPGEPCGPNSFACGGC